MLSHRGEESGRRELRELGRNDLDCQRKSVHRRAEACDGLSVAVGELKAGKLGGAPREQPDRGKVQGFGGATRLALRWKGEGFDPVQHLAADPQGLATGHKQAGGDVRSDEPFGQSADGQEQVLAVIEQHEGSLFPQMIRDGRDRVGRVQAQTEARCHQLGHKPVVGRRRQVNEVDPAGERFLLRPGNCDREARFSNPARADEGHQFVRVQATHDCFDIVVATDQVLGLGQDGCLGRWAGCSNLHYLDRSDEPVPASDDRRDVARSREGVVQGPADASHVDLQVSLVDKVAGPGKLEQVALPDLLARARQQQAQDIASPAAELNWPALSQ